MLAAERAIWAAAAGLILAVAALFGLGVGPASAAVSEPAEVTACHVVGSAAIWSGSAWECRSKTEAVPLGRIAWSPADCHLFPRNVSEWLSSAGDGAPGDGASYPVCGGSLIGLGPYSGPDPSDADAPADAASLVEDWREWPTSGGDPAPSASAEPTATASPSESATVTPEPSVTASPSATVGADPSASPTPTAAGSAASGTVLLDPDQVDRWTGAGVLFGSLVLFVAGLVGAKTLFGR